MQDHVITQRAILASLFSAALLGSVSLGVTKAGAQSQDDVTTCSEESGDVAIAARSHLANTDAFF
jgi:hypothetical protein